MQKRTAWKLKTNLLLLIAVGWSSLVQAGTTPTLVVPPRPLPGPNAVACSNVVQDFGRLKPGDDVQTYWEGVPRNDGSARYITDLLAEPANTLSTTVVAPDDQELFGSFAGKSIPYVIIVCYPTTMDNPRPAYTLPNGNVVPHMHRGTDAPLWADTTTQFPLLLFSHGLDGSPLSNDYIGAITLLASYGYVVAAPFHGDGRFGSLHVSDLEDLSYLLTHLSDFVAMQALRPLSLSATLDKLATSSQWSGRIDPARIGGFGASLGGESMLLLAGAQLTTSPGGLSSKKVTMDSRLKAAVGYVPYFGNPLIPAFGRDERGLDNVNLPFLAISGTADTTAPIFEAQRGIARLQGPRELVGLQGVMHGFDVFSTNDIFTWSLVFLDAEVRGNKAAQDQLSQMAQVAGGGDDRVVVPLDNPTVSNYGGLWWNAPAGSESGWGINVAHQADTIFMTWFTYDSTGNNWWLSMTAEKSSAGTYTGTIYQTSGPAYFADPFDSSKVVRKPVGEGTLSFTDVDTGTFGYTVNGIKQTKPIVRQAFGPVPTCTYDSSISPPAATNYQDLWWNMPAGSEAGWGVNLTHQGDNIFATWFTYDANGAPLWLSATAAYVPDSDRVYQGQWYRTSGPAFSAVPFNPDNVTRVPVGTVAFAFTSGNTASMAYTVDRIAQTKIITREVLHGAGTVCE